MYNSENLQEKWPVLKHPDLPEIKDNYKRALLQSSWKTKKKPMKEDAAFLSETITYKLILVVLSITTTQF